MLPIIVAEELLTSANVCLLLLIQGLLDWEINQEFCRKDFAQNGKMPQLISEEVANRTFHKCTRGSMVMIRRKSNTSYV